MSPSPLNQSRTIEYVLASLSRRGIRPTLDAEEGRVPERIQAIVPAESELGSEDMERAIYTRDIEIRHEDGERKTTIYLSTYILPTTTPKTFEQIDLLSIEVNYPAFMEYASFDILGDRAIPLFDHHALPEAPHSVVVLGPTSEKAYSREEKALLEPKDSLKVMDWVINEFLRLTR